MNKRLKARLVAIAALTFGIVASNVGVALAIRPPGLPPL